MNHSKPAFAKSFANMAWYGTWKTVYLASFSLVEK